MDKHTEVRQPVLIDKSEKASLIKKDNSVPGVTTRSGQVVQPPIRLVYN